MSEATTSAMKQAIRVRMVEQAQEMSVCVELQQRIWAYAPSILCRIRFLLWR